MYRTIHLMSGLPASGKTTYVQQQVASTAIHRDIFRASLRKWAKSDAYFPVPSNIEWDFWMARCNAGLVCQPDRDFYIDQTTIGEKSLAKIICGLALRPTDRIILHVFRTSFQTCLARNAKRAGFENVPLNAMESMHNSFLKWEPENARRLDWWKPHYDIIYHYE